MSFQNIRRHYEAPVLAVCDTLRIDYYGPNELEFTPDATGEYVLARIQFDNITTEPPIGCIPLENVSGVFIVEHFCQKGIGPARTQDVMQRIICNLLQLNEPPTKDSFGVRGTIGPISGPRFTALEGRPFYFSAISMPIRAKVLDEVP